MCATNPGKLVVMRADRGCGREATHVSVELAELEGSVLWGALDVIIDGLEERLDHVGVVPESRVPCRTTTTAPPLLTEPRRCWIRAGTSPGRVCTTNRSVESRVRNLGTATKSHHNSSNSAWDMRDIVTLSLEREGGVGDYAARAGRSCAA